ncbi:ATP-dependent DNA ligase [Streptomyces sp. RKAG337]|uniref:ATP-dependent DNA ligase n=1 Tax=Streptomyces sp. RKAG337 TaxID=2893404 RepID=UPI00203492BF|nr:ATP-dependent DNA ligase [Streptomyces sp. RKAG337]MCM2431072.1 ATP-dependent DNA ligase [Streptomyces sp. RKAG337]
MVLHPPVEPMLAQPAEALPRPEVIARGAVMEPKWDGYRMLLFTGVADADGVRSVQLQSRRGAPLQRRFPDLVRAAEALPDALVLDGELVVWEQGRVSFEALHQRATAARGAVAGLADRMPAHYVVFDVLQAGGRHLVPLAYRERRKVLEELFAQHRLEPPWTLCPVTADLDQARQWMEQWTRVGVEGVVIKNLDQPYLPGDRGWRKVKYRSSQEAVIAAVTGSLGRPGTVLLGRYDAAGRLHRVGRSTTLTAAASRSLAASLTPASSDHPWAGRTFSAGWGRGERMLDVELVAPALVAEVSADTAVDGGRWRHPVRFQRVRADMAPADVPPFDAG